MKYWIDTLSLRAVNKPSGIPDNYERVGIYPNPTNGLLTVETKVPGYLSVEISALNGQLIYITEMEGPALQINISSFQKGCYIITIRSDNFITTKKIIKL